VTRQLLVPLDGSKPAEAILPVAREICEAFDLAPRFIAVLEGTEGPLSRDAPERADDLFTSYVRDLCERYALSRPDVSTAAVVGDPVETILHAAHDSTMLALASHGKGGFRATVFGSVADRVVRRSPVPALVVPAVESPHGLSAGPVVVTLDGSPESERALPVGRDAAAKLHRAVVLLRSYSLIPLGGVQYFPLDYLETVEKDAREALEHLAHPGEAQELVNGPTVDAIVSAAERLDASLLVMTPSGKGLARRFTLGSTTERVLHRAGRPVLVLPHASTG